MRLKLLSILLALAVTLIVLTLPSLRVPDHQTWDYEATYFFSENASAATEAEPGSRGIAFSWKELDHDRRLALYQHPPSAYRFRHIPTAGRAELLVAPTVDPETWKVGGDGVDFQVYCRESSGDLTSLLDLRLRPPADSLEKTGWNDLSVPLDGCSGPETDVVLKTTCGSSDCRADWAFWGEPKVRYQRQARVAERPLILLISVDTLRPDRLALYGAERPTAPHLSRLAGDGVTFETALAPAPWTIPSHASLFTSTFPYVHATTGFTKIPRQLPTLAEVLKAADVETLAVIDHPWLARSDFRRGFDRFDAGTRPPGIERRTVAVTEQHLLRYLEEPSTDPLFVFWHIMDVHAPYGATQPFSGRYRKTIDPEETAFPPLDELKKIGYHDYLQLDRFSCVEDLIATYDEGVDTVDAAIGRVLDHLRRVGLYDSATIVVTADHGESFFDHRIWIGHGLFLTDNEIRIPLIVKLPGNRHAGQRVSAMVRLVDVAPLIVEAAGIEPPPTFQGTSLFSLDPEHPERMPRVAFGFSSNTGAAYVRTNEVKYISSWGFPRQEVAQRHLHPKADTPVVQRIEAGEKLFDLTSDPEERTNLAGLGDRQELLAQLRAGAEARRSATADRSARPTELSAADVERLKALGYLTDLD